MHATLQTKLSCLPREVKARVTGSAVEYPAWCSDTLVQSIMQSLSTHWLGTYNHMHLSSSTGTQFHINTNNDLSIYIL